MKIKLIGCSFDGYWYYGKIGQEFEVAAQLPSGDYKLKERGIGGVCLYIDRADAEVVEEQPVFNLKLHPWKIRTGSKEKSELVQKWLKEQGISWYSQDDDDCPLICTGDQFLTNMRNRTEVHNYMLFGMSAFEDHPAQEIVIEYETVVKNVVFPSVPMVRTEEQKQLDSLLEKIAELNNQAEILKADMEGKQA